MPLGTSVYITLIGIYAGSIALIAWTVWKNHTEPENGTRGWGEV